MTARLERWRGRLTRRRSSPVAIVFLSSAVGFPPFFAITALAGALKLNFAGFLAAGTGGRLIRFAALVMLGTKVRRCGGAEVPEFEVQSSTFVPISKRSPTAL
jgi:membrane protein YqaA with SNARE-associated domain